MAAVALPEISAAALKHATDADDPAVQALRSACADVGFFCVTDHGVSKEVIDTAFLASESFFALPEATKLNCKGTADNGWRGYGPYGNGQNCSPNSCKPERKETYYYGAPLAHETGPSVPAVPNFDESVAAFYAGLMELSRSVLRGLSLSLGLDAGHFEKIAFQDPVAKVLLTKYPPLQEKDELSCGVHTDCGFLTILCADGGSGLQVQRLDGTWLSVDSHRYTFCCNIGDLAQRWTNDVYKSTPHRVLNDSGEVRRSLIFFNNLDEQAVVECLPSCVTPERPAKYKKTTCGEYVAIRLGFMRDNYEGDCEYKNDDMPEPEKETIVQGAIASNIA
eukprot:TRINITY_DN90695_c0_g1_i1.p1 TRINITY_DN90695_c0_g1~~TRINITY_DN90695_c0_g1_i1.p1  ORF type:complete len:335 (-),score=66.64 TRINITY_DN90695_c0_g1_i1:60-1064(-)